MQRAVLYLIVVISIFPVFSDEYIESENFLISQSAFNLYNKFRLYDDPNLFLESCERKLSIITEYLHAENWRDQYPENQRKIILEFTDNEPSHVEGGYAAPDVRVPKIYLNSSVQYGFPPLCHEITHLVLLDYSSNTIREGLATYVEEIVCSEPNVFSFFYPPHAASMQFIENREIPRALVDCIGSNSPIYRRYTKGRYRSNYYILTYSFCTFLIEEYGIERLLNIYNSQELMNDYSVIYRKTYEELKEEWMIALERNNQPIIPYETWVEMKRTEYFKRIES